MRFEATEPMFKEAVVEAEAIIAAARLGRTRQAPSGAKSTPRAPKRHSGHCIRCRVDTPMDASRPFCFACFQTWSSFGNPDYVERWCHQCGDEWDTSMNRPRLLLHIERQNLILD